MKGFGIYVKNNLLEPKHVLNMGEAVWLYLWLLDKMTSVNENGVGKVLGNQPITYEMVHADLGMPLRTYRRWVDALRATGYIQTIRTPRGLCMVVTKAEKIFTKSDVPKSVHHKRSDVPKSKSDVPKSVPRSAKSAHAIRQYKDNTKDNTSNTTEQAPEYFEEISKTYYEAIKALKLPVRNHINLKAKIKQMVREDDPQKLLAYLSWIRDKYAVTDWDFKPQLNEGLDIYNKRVQIENSLKQAAKEQQANKVFRI